MNSRINRPGTGFYWCAAGLLFGLYGIVGKLDYTAEREFECASYSKLYNPETDECYKPKLVETRKELYYAKTRASGALRDEGAQHASGAGR